MDVIARWNIHKFDRDEVRISVQLVLFTIIGMSVNIMPIFLASFPVILPAMEHEFGASRSALTIGYALLATALALFSPIFGHILDAWGPVRLLIPAIVGLAAAFLLFLILPAHLPAYLALCTLIGCIGAASYQFVYCSVLPRWFDHRLGLAFGFAGTGAALGLGLMPSYSAYLLEHFGWRQTYAILGLTSLAIALPNLLFLYGTRLASKSAIAIDSAGNEAESGQTLRQALAQPVFWRLAFSYLLICLLINGHIIHLVPMMVERGVNSSSAAGAMAALGISMMLARLSCGYILDYVNPARLGALLFLVGTIGATIVWVGASLPMMICGIALIGVALGVENELISYMARAVFGLRAYGAALGALSTAFMFGVILGPLVMSVTHDATGSYTMGRAILILCGLTAAALHFGVGVRFRSQHRPMEAEAATGDAVS